MKLAADSDCWWHDGTFYKANINRNWDIFSLLFLIVSLSAKIVCESDYKIILRFPYCFNRKSFFCPKSFSLFYSWSLESSSKLELQILTKAFIWYFIFLNVIFTWYHNFSLIYGYECFLWSKSKLHSKLRIRQQITSLHPLRTKSSILFKSSTKLASNPRVFL